MKMCWLRSALLSSLLLSVLISMSYILADPTHSSFHPAMIKRGMGSYCLQHVSNLRPRKDTVHALAALQILDLVRFFAATFSKRLSFK